MHVFITGATGWVGSAVTDELLKAGHEVTGLARDRNKAAALAAAGARAVEGTLDDLDVLRQAASSADAVIHTAFNHDFSKFMEAAAQDQHAIEMLGSALEGSDRPLLVTSGLLGLPPGATEKDAPGPGPRKSEPTARALAERGVRAATVRLASSVHGIGDWGFVPILVRMARETGVSAYIAGLQNNWSGVHRLDAAKVYRLALEQGVTEPVYHAVADEAVPFKQIAELIGRHFGLPVEPRDRDHFGWFAHFAGAELSASSAHTRSVLVWEPTGPSLVVDLDQPGYCA
ncbi:SDR family oxidoreductase [Manganibacter manganicus]|uniref:3-beta hydroxysteroid dehydrogenase n=1 Tax=Manganibacter manganicus TaxID=1873176 RepID=A0A1V8RL06_9HYPH|nr:SDR family oxidoreductase [Pseudaminobacter manganicus]OQM73895.1 3-beta hydroxysteroid dehydrogenase [Pseudaminobacter manganicus]